MRKATGRFLAEKSFYAIARFRGQGEDVSRVTECRKNFGNPVFFY